MNKLINPYSLSSGSTRMIITTSKNGSGFFASTQLILTADPFVDGSVTARLLQSNDLDVDINDWNYLPEDALTLVVGSNLLQTLSHTCLYLAVEILVDGDEPAGEIKIAHNFQ